ncbi:MAG: aminotransferase class IV [Microcella sp.]|uniref:aminotransferase class IV n=1 Tax=Microcella sp. TaxID=1913979 RepID=UPI0024C773F2|nr:aminotransferase class IV [Microcella sp.]UYN84048.1 MAG: aminotransferase class IV [Microcella sp.]
MVEGEGHPAEPGLHAWVRDGWQLVDWCDPHDGAALVADSWRVVDARVRGLDRHRARFLHGVEQQRPNALPAADSFIAAVVDALPRTRDWFPRIELRERGDDTQLWYRLRPTPLTSTEVVLATSPRDVRTQPLVKGPDLDALQALRTEVQPLGAGEAVIVDEYGHIVEGAYSAVLWWRDGVLVRPDDSLPRIASVTAGLVLDAARAEGVPLAEERARPHELAGCEVWVLSALHGLRAATNWVDAPALAPPRRAAQGRAWLEAAETPLAQR